jgi:hypothetical protein
MGERSREDIEADTAGIGRDALLKRGLLLGGAAAVAAGVAPSVAAAKGSVTVEVAVLGDTYRQLTAAAVAGDPDDVRGSTFYVEGFIFSPGTIKGEDFNPYAHQPKGLMVATGSLMSFGRRPAPFYVSNHVYTFGNIRFDRLFPANQLASYGLEGSDDESQAMHRAITGGTGIYAGASGEVVQTTIGVNSTDLPGGAAPTYKFEFKLA